MKIVYISNSIIPSRTANSIHVMKMCQAFADNGHEVVLLAPNRYKEYENGVDDVYEYYGVRKNFEIRKLPYIYIRILRNFYYAYQTLKEIKIITGMPDFKGYLSDLGGPSANMYRMKGKDISICRKCKRPSCISPKVCKNLNANHTPMLELYKEVDSIPGIKKSFIGSGVRYDLLLNRYDDNALNDSANKYMREIGRAHV